MGTLNWSMAPIGASPGKSVISSEVSASGSHATSAIASNVAGLDAQVGQVLRVHSDGPMRITFGGATASASVGHYLPSGATTDFEIDPGSAGTVSVTDVA